MEIKQLRTEGRAAPYITIVDSGLAMAAQHLVAALAISVGQGRVLLDLDGDEFLPDVEYIEEVANRLCDELAKRTF